MLPHVDPGLARWKARCCAPNVFPLPHEHSLESKPYLTEFAKPSLCDCQGAVGLTVRRHSSPFVGKAIAKETG